ncbi:MAG: PIN domain-containing protein [Paracoccaceae bacterium]
MRLFLDACVLYPVATREILLNYARTGGFTPLWSARVLEEWARAAGAKQGAAEEDRARGDAALLRATFTDGEIADYEALEADFRSRDPADAHVVAAARKGGADAILTFNIRDFPLRLLRPFVLGRLHPDEFLSAAFQRDGQRLEATLAPLAEMAAARNANLRSFLKRAALPRLGKAWERGGDNTP